MRGTWYKQWLAIQEHQVMEMLPSPLEERERTLAWLARDGQLIADSMFRYAEIRYEERKDFPEEGLVKPPAGLTTFFRFFLPGWYRGRRERRKSKRRAENTPTLWKW